MTQTTKPISPLRRRMLDDMRMRKLSDKTQSHYIRAVVNLTRFLGRSPDTATAEDLRRYQLHLVEHDRTRTALNRTITALRFLLRRDPGASRGARENEYRARAAQAPRGVEPGGSRAPD